MALAARKCPNVGRTCWHAAFVVASCRYTGDQLLRAALMAGTGQGCKKDGYASSAPKSNS